MRSAPAAADEFKGEDLQRPPGSSAPWWLPACSSTALAVVCLLPVGPACRRGRGPHRAPAPRPRSRRWPPTRALQLCDPVARKGPKKLKALLTATYGSTSFGITRACSGEHGRPPSTMEGRALDWMISGKAQRANAKRVLAWLSAKDAAGNHYAMARRMGLMYIDLGQRDVPLLRHRARVDRVQRLPTTLSSSYDTTCHRNHVHFSFTWDGAAGKTSYLERDGGHRTELPDDGTPAAATRRPEDRPRVRGAPAEPDPRHRRRRGRDRALSPQPGLVDGGEPSDRPAGRRAGWRARHRSRRRDPLDPGAGARTHRPSSTSSRRVRRGAAACLHHGHERSNGLGAGHGPPRVRAVGSVLTLSTGSTDVDGRRARATTALPTAPRRRSTRPTRLGCSTPSTSERVARAQVSPGRSTSPGWPACRRTARPRSRSRRPSTTASASGGVTVYDPGDAAPPTTTAVGLAPRTGRRADQPVSSPGSRPTAPIVVRNSATGTRRRCVWTSSAGGGLGSFRAGSRYVPLAPKEVIDTTQDKGSRARSAAGAPTR